VNWLKDWFNRVDIGIRPRDVFSGVDVNLYPFTPRGIEWVQANIHRFDEPKWSERERCLMLSESDSGYFSLGLLVGQIELAGLRVRFYGRLKGWDGNSPWPMS